jgi:ribonucleotide reductase alpha subunit
MDSWIEAHASDILSKDFLKKYTHKKINWGFDGLGYIVYKTHYARRRPDGKLEDWPETIARCLNGAQAVGAKYTKAEAERLFDYIFNFKCCFSGRGLWQLGTPLTKTIADSLLSCWVTKVSEIKDFHFIFMESMMGGGVGAVISREYTQELPRVKRGVHCYMKNTKDADWICPDSKEGWGQLWKKILESYLITGESFSYSSVCIRPPGEPLKTFGGIAPGPKPLMDGAAELIKILERRAGKKLRTQDVADIVCCGGQIVKSGGIRRTALILLGDVDDVAFLYLKRWDLDPTLPSYRSNSNNSLICSDYTHLLDRYWDGFAGNGEAYGLFNLKNAKKFGRMEETKIGNFDLFDDDIIAPNPCLPPWSKVLTPNGIRELKDVKINDLIWSKEGWTTIKNKWSSGIKKVFEYKTTAGCFYSTENHKIISDGDRVEAKDAESIDVVSGEYKSEIIMSSQDILDGVVFGDGSHHKASNNLIYLCIGENDKDYFGSEIKDFIKKYRPALGETSYEVDTTLSYLEIPKTYDRKIPDRFLYGDRNKVCGFLRGLFSANGSLCGGRITLKAASFDVIKNVQLMLSFLGINSYFTTNKSHNVKFNNGEYLCKQSYDINITRDRNKFFKIIGFIQKYKNEKLEETINQVTRFKKQKNNYDIVAVDDFSEEEVFDITVDNQSHTFWCNGFDVSNCGEALLADKECCNLSELMMNNIQSKEEMYDCTMLLYKTNKAIAAYHYLFEETNEIVHHKMRLGIGVTGVCQNPFYEEWCDYTYKKLREFDKIYSKDNGWHQSIRLTVCKPSGTMSLLSGASPGGNTGYSKYHIRTMRFSSMDSIIPLLREAGYKIEPEVRIDGSLNHDILVAYFPCRFSDKTICEDKSDYLDQLERVKKLQACWADQSVSNTIYYNSEDLPKIKNWLKDNYKYLKTVSFMLHKGHNFKQPVLAPITKEEYEIMVKAIKPLGEFTNGHDADEELNNLECSSGVCPVK